MSKSISGNCKQCGIYRKFLHRDHIIPKSMGGSNDVENIQHLCANCHEDKTAIDMKKIIKMTWNDPNRRIKQSKALKKSWKIRGMKKARGKIMNEIWSSSENRKKVKKSNTATWSSSELRAKHSEIMKEVWKRRKSHV